MRFVDNFFHRINKLKNALMIRSAICTGVPIVFINLTEKGGVRITPHTRSLFTNLVLFNAFYM